MVDVGGFRIAVRCAGRGRPAFVFEGGHLNTHISANYGIVQAQMVSDGVTRVCWYDRAGLGQSEPRPAGIVDPAEIGRELLAGLGQVGVKPPIVLAGGSFGGLLVRVFAATYPDDVSGLMFIDAVDARSPLVTYGSRYTTEGDSRIDMGRLQAELRAAPPLDRLPVVVITASASTSDATWMEGQRHLSHLSHDTMWFVARDTLHGVTDQVPELVSRAAAMLVEAARTGDPLGPCSELADLGARCLS
jgi:pimeloyl-ACP methyl ester carboxylesterase